VPARDGAHGAAADRLAAVDGRHVRRVESLKRRSFFKAVAAVAASTALPCVSAAPPPACSPLVLALQAEMDAMYTALARQLALHLYGSEPFSRILLATCKPVSLLPERQ
jgi:hypothetical protein